MTDASKSIDRFFAKVFAQHKRRIEEARAQHATCSIRPVWPVGDGCKVVTTRRGSMVFTPDGWGLLPMIVVGGWDTRPLNRALTNTWGSRE